MTGPLSYGDKRDDRPNADNHSKHGEHAAQLVQTQALETRLYNSNKRRTKHYLFLPDFPHAIGCTKAVFVYQTIL